MATRPFSIEPHCFDGLSHGQYLAYDAQTHHFYASFVDDAEQNSEVAEAVKSHLFTYNKDGGALTEDLQKLHQCASKFLDRQKSLHRSELDKGLAGCKDSSHLMNLEMIDRLVVAFTFQQISPEDFKQMALDRIMRTFKTKVAREQLQKWFSEPTHRASKEKAREMAKQYPKHPDFKNEGVFNDRTEAARAFALHPAQVQFVKDHFLEKHVGTRNGDRIEVDPETKNLKIKFNGVMRSVVDIERDHISERHRLYERVHTEGSEGETRGARLFYKDKLGLVPCSEENPALADPEQFQNAIPLFKKKEKRNHQDFRLEVWTAIKLDEQHMHGFIGLKTPTGEVRHVGFFRREGEEKPILRLMETSRGDFHADGDRYDFMRFEPFMKRTSIAVTEDQYNRAYGYLLDRQKDEVNRNFNVANQNCTDIVNETLHAALGIELPVESSLFDIYLGFDLKNNFFVKYIPPVRIAAFIVCAVLSVLRNMLMLIIGGAFSGEENERTFGSFWEIFNPNAGRLHHQHDKTLAR